MGPVEIVPCVTNPSKSIILGWADVGPRKAPREIPRPAGESAGLRDDASKRLLQDDALKKKVKRSDKSGEG